MSRSPQFTSDGSHSHSTVRVNERRLRGHGRASGRCSCRWQIEDPRPRSAPHRRLWVAPLSLVIPHFIPRTLETPPDHSDPWRREPLSFMTIPTRPDHFAHFDPSLNPQVSGSNPEGRTECLARGTSPPSQPLSSGRLQQPCAAMPADSPGSGRTSAMNRPFCRCCSLLPGARHEVAEDALGHSDRGVNHLLGDDVTLDLFVQQQERTGGVRSL